ncbi:MAG: histone deacetylase [Microlunatus sp.]|nr:histone deacetylase [Microlunatus sp.]MDN5770980.1 histone deacetylase [Microlunatus sp.]MDN5805399.1 histone deacetylase [Microlunatus sp.]
MAARDLWYAAYGSNLDRRRFEAYLCGGRPAGAVRTYVGARDPSPPVDDRPLLLHGRIFFAWESPTWGGGIAFYDPDLVGPDGGPATVYGRAYRITAEQFSDLAAQEMRRTPGTDLDLSDVLQHRRHTYGPGRYETLHLVGELEGAPVLTFTAPRDHGLSANPPAPAYLATMVRGLRECHGLSRADALAYLDAAPGAR